VKKPEKKHNFHSKKKKEENKAKGPLSRYVEGTIHISHKGIGIVRVLHADDTVEIEHNFLHTACNGDTVRVLLHPKRKDRDQTGEVAEILRRSKIGFSGILEKEHDTYFLIPSDLKMYSDIVIPSDKLNGAKVGQKVFVIITEWKDAKKAPIGEITKVLGMPMEHNAEMEAIAMEKGFDATFPSDVDKEAKAIASRGITESDLK